MSRFYAKCCCGAEIKVSALGVNEFKADAWWNLHAMCPKAWRTAQPLAKAEVETKHDEPVA
jgi:hypothetical protein